MPDRVVAIVGATATGKTALGVELAQALGGEIINADSRQVYLGMDIGTAKPTLDERVRAPHWVVDVVDPDETFTLAAFLDRARAAIDDIVSRGKTPLVVGGTGQYVWALLEGWRVPRVPPDRELRARLEASAAKRGAAPVLEELRRLDPASAEVIDQKNLRRVIRAIEVSEKTGRPFSEWQRKDPPSFQATIIGLAMDRAQLHRRIDSRVDAMIESGLIDEVRALNARGFGCDLPSMSGIGYRQICEHLRGACSLGEAVARIKTETHRLARMQNTWFSPSDQRIVWLDAAGADLRERALSLLR